MDLELEGEVAVVVGAAKGIGRVIADAFGSERAKVALIDRDAAVAEAAGEIRARHGVCASSLVCDVTDYSALGHAVAELQARLGRAAHVVHAAAIGSGQYGFPFWNLTPTDWPRVLEVNVLGAVHVAHAFAPAMIEARHGTLLFMASVAGQIGSQTDPPYSASKAAVINFAQCAAKDLAPYNVRVNTICPGMIKTALNRSVWEAWNAQQPPAARQTYDDWAEEKIRRTVPLGRWQEPQDIAQLAVFLASPRAKNITGQTLNVDGGQVMHW